ncbi:MAG: hypothetical protein AAGI71_01720 [Bacteroidota bacterium]
MTDEEPWEDPDGREDVWDEEQWEAFLRAQDRRVRRYMDLVHAYMIHWPPPEPDAPARRSWEDGLRAYIARKGLHPDDPILAAFFSETRPFVEPDPEDEEPTEESWLEVDNLALFQQATALVTDVLTWTNALSITVKNATLVDYCSHLTQIPVHLAKGHRFGTERDALGGYIACVKRALTHANQALGELADQKGAAYMTPARYATLYERTYELRNALGLYVQHLRERFNLGVD